MSEVFQSFLSGLSVGAVLSAAISTVLVAVLRKRIERKGTGSLLIVVPFENYPRYKATELSDTFLIYISDWIAAAYTGSPDSAEALANIRRWPEAGTLSDTIDFLDKSTQPDNRWSEHLLSIDSITVNFQLALFNPGTTPILVYLDSPTIGDVTAGHVGTIGIRLDKISITDPKPLVLAPASIEVIDLAASLSLDLKYDRLGSSGYFAKTVPLLRELVARHEATLLLCDGINANVSVDISFSIKYLKAKIGVLQHRPEPARANARVSAQVYCESQPSAFARKKLEDLLTEALANPKVYT